MLLKLLIICLLSFTFFQVQSCNKSKQDEVRKIFNIDSKVELLFFFRKDTSSDEKKAFNKKIDDSYLLIKTNEGYISGPIQAVFGIDKSGFEGFGITIRPNATEEQREDIMKLLKESPIVYKVCENVVPNEINDLDKPSNKKQ